MPGIKDKEGQGYRCCHKIGKQRWGTNVHKMGYMAPLGLPERGQGRLQRGYSCSLCLSLSSKGYNVGLWWGARVSVVGKNMVRMW